MLSDKEILNVSLVVSLIGAAGLFIVTAMMEPEDVYVSEISRDDAGKMVRITGVIESFSTYEGNIFMEVSDESGVIKIVFFQSDVEKQPWVYDLQTGNMIIIEGKIIIYKNELEMQAISIKI